MSGGVRVEPTRTREAQQLSTIVRSPQLLGETDTGLFETEVPVEGMGIDKAQVTGDFQPSTTCVGQCGFRGRDQRAADTATAMRRIDHQSRDSANGPGSVQHDHSMQRRHAQNLTVAGGCDQR